MVKIKKVACVAGGSLLETAGAVNRHAKNPLVVARDANRCIEERERVGVAGFSLLTPGGQKRTRLLPFLRVKSSDFEVDFDYGMRHFPVACLISSHSNSPTVPRGFLVCLFTAPAVTSSLYWPNTIYYFILLIECLK